MSYVNCGIDGYGGLMIVHVDVVHNVQLVGWCVQCYVVRVADDICY